MERCSIGLDRVAVILRKNISASPRFNGMERSAVYRKSCALSMSTRSLLENFIRVSRASFQDTAGYPAHRLVYELRVKIHDTVFPLIDTRQCPPQ